MVCAGKMYTIFDSISMFLGASSVRYISCMCVQIAFSTTQMQCVALVLMPRILHLAIEIENINQYY
jgi:hypothetical protein